MNKIVFRRVFLAELALLASFEGSGIVIANGNEFSCNEGESLFLFRKGSEPLDWESSDNNVAQVKDHTGQIR